MPLSPVLRLRFTFQPLSKLESERDYSRLATQRREEERRKNGGGILVAGLQTWNHELISVKGYLNTGRVARLINDVWGGLASGKLARLSLPPSPPPRICGRALRDCGSKPCLCYEGCWGGRYHPTSPIEYLRNFMTLPRHRQESRAPNFLPISSSDPRLNHRFFLSVTYSPYFLPPFLVPAIGIVEKGIGEKNFQRYFAPTIDANSRTRDRP